MAGFSTVASALLGRKRGWRYPQKIKAIMLDLDGTLMASYRMLEAIHKLQEKLVQIGFTRKDAEDFLQQYMSAYPFQDILHRPQKTLEAMEKFFEEHGVKNVEDRKAIIEIIRPVQDEAFKLYDGVLHTLQAAKKAGVPVCIYTNSPDFFVAKRLLEARINDGAATGIDASLFTAIWTRRHETYEPLSWAGDGASPQALEIADRMISYTGKKGEGHDAPLKELMQATGITDPREILFVGEGTSDLKVVYRDQKNPGAIFAFQEQGARDISDKQQKVNGKLRPGAEDLGINAVNRLIRKLGIGGDIIRLKNGFSDLNRLIRQGKINLMPPDIMPRVINNQLVGDTNGSMLTTTFQAGNSRPEVSIWSRALQHLRF